MATRRMPEVNAAVWPPAPLTSPGSMRRTRMPTCAGIPAKGTMGHMWIQPFDSELEAFRRFVEAFPEGAVLLSTRTIRCDRRANAITVAKEMKPGAALGIRLDSGDIVFVDPAHAR